VDTIHMALEKLAIHSRMRGSAATG
jgi:hypothetical protein